MGSICLDSDRTGTEVRFYPAKLPLVPAKIPVFLTGGAERPALPAVALHRVNRMLMGVERRAGLELALI
jgi:hypothetical protein